MSIEPRLAARMTFSSLCEYLSAEYYEAGKSYRRLFNNIESACQFISATWPTL